jgi:nicotinate-nucleotide--dimethylbenzimidazole phosphoribosyltransferase
MRTRFPALNGADRSPTISMVGLFIFVVTEVVHNRRQQHMNEIINQTIARIQPLDDAAMQAARARQDQLTKPAGSLGRLESLSVQIAGITRQSRPRLKQPTVIVMAGDHGITHRGVSAYPQEVTPQMVFNFLNGGAAINVLSRHVGARVVVVDVGVAADMPAHPELISKKVAKGTRDFSHEQAMTCEEAEAAVQAGIDVVSAQIDAGADLIATGDMGIGNTTPSSAIVAAITGRPVAQVTGRGTGVDDAGLARKVAVIEQALALHRPNPRDGWDVLAKVGGLEIAGLAGVIIGAAARHVPVVIDGFISGAAALIASAIAPAAQPYLIAAHCSVEIGHRVMLDRLELEPLLDFNLRLGEGTGAALGMSLCVAACKVLDEMATFGEAGVSEKETA